MMNATATRLSREALEEEIAALHQEAEEAKADPDKWEFAFVLLAKADEFQAFLDADR